MLKYLTVCIALTSPLICMDKPRPIAVCGSYDHLQVQYKNDPTWTELHDAAYKCTDIIHLKIIIEQTLAARGTVDIEDKFGQTPLWWAVHNGKINAVKLLLGYGARVDHADMFKRTVRSKMEANPLLKALLNTGINP